jgi:hypothetical protein
MLLLVNLIQQVEVEVEDDGLIPEVERDSTQKNYGTKDLVNVI